MCGIPLVLPERCPRGRACANCTCSYQFGEVVAESAWRRLYRIGNLSCTVHQDEAVEYLGDAHDNERYHALYR